MLYRSIRIGAYYVLLTALMIVLPIYGQKQQKAPSPGPTTAAEPSPESLEACKLELQRIAREALKGASASFSSTDERILETCRAAADAGRASRIANHPSRSLRNRVKPELVLQAKETSSRMITEFNEKGIDARFSSSDRDEVRIFAGVATAVEVLQMASSPSATKGIDPEVVEEAKKSAAAMISKFNENGYGASFSSWEVAPLERFLDEVEEKKE